MKGIELSELFFNEIARPSLERAFGNVFDSIAVGFCGEGSECFGYDDDLSRDHDFRPCFDVWVNDGEEKLRDELQKWYGGLPKEYAGIRLQAESAQGSDRHGVRSVGEYYTQFTGNPQGPQTWQEWFYTPSHYFAAATNGKVFTDIPGCFSAVRGHILHGMPGDVKLKKIAACAMHMAQSGQYNYARCLKHGEPESAWLAKGEFIRAALKMLYLFNDAHAPYYKWIFRGAEGFVHARNLLPLLRELTVTDGEKAVGIIEDVSAGTIRQLRRERLTDGDWDYLEPHAFLIFDQIKNNDLKQIHIMEG